MCPTTATNSWARQVGAADKKGSESGRRRHSVRACVPQRSFAFLGPQTAPEAALRSVILDARSPHLTWVALLVQACGRGNDPSNTGTYDRQDRHSTTPRTTTGHELPPQEREPRQRRERNERNPVHQGTDHSSRI